MNIINPEIITMGTREIAGMLGKQHHHIKSSADYLVEKKVINGGVALTAIPYVNQQNGQTYYEYHLNKRDSIILVAQNSPEFTARLVDRWEELEEAVKQPALLPNQVAIDKDQLIWLQGEVIERLKNQHKAEKKLKETYKAKLDKPKQAVSDKPDHSLISAIINYVRCNGRRTKVEIVNDRKELRLDSGKIPLKADVSKAVDYMVDAEMLIKLDRNNLDVERINGGDVF